MRELPTGTVTFLFTDIEGSTRLLEEHGNRYADLLADHRRVLREAFERHGGVEVDTQGDAFFVAFPSATAAVAAAVDAQMTLHVPVRMGIHTGEPQLTGEGYVGMDVHRAARICSAAHGGQVVVSEASARLLQVALRDLGEHRLKDLGRPVRLYQLGEGDFPPLRSLNQTNLPAQPGPLIGRERELDELLALIEEVRVVTLTGPGGSGKTRLALQAAAELVDRFEGGVFFVSLAPVVDPELVVPTLGQTIGAMDGVAEHIRDRRTLVLLDNLEQLVEATPALAELLERCPNLRLLCTSRAVLRIAGEYDYPLDPLPEDDAVELFRARATVANPIDAVFEICRRLDGLPLAIELAAARTRLLPPDKLLERLHRALPVLTGGRRDAPARQQTLRATVEWSYELLEPAERELFGSLAVFSGGFSVEAAEAICDADLDVLESLVEKSLLRRWASARVGMLETIRELALEKLEDSAKVETIRRRHAEFFLALAESANLMNESEGEQRHDLVLVDQANLRAALDWSREADPELGLRLAVSLENFWTTNHPAEGVRVLSELIELAPDAPPSLRAVARRCRASASYYVGEFDAAVADLEEALREFRRLNDDIRTGIVLFRLAVDALRTEDRSKAQELLEEARRLQLGRFAKGEAQILSLLSNFEFEEGREENGFRMLDESAALCRRSGFRWWEAAVLQTIAQRKLLSGSWREALQPAREALGISSAIRDRQAVVWELAMLAGSAAQAGDAPRAGRLWGAIEAEEQRGPIGDWESDRAEVEAMLKVVSGADFDEARGAGRSLSRDEAVDYALADD